MSAFLRLACLALVVLGAGDASAALACSISASPVPIGGIYASTANTDVAGTFTVTCTRNPATDPRKPTIWIGVDQTTAGRTMVRETAADTLGYTIYHKANYSGIWLNSGNVNPNANANGGLQVTIDFGGGGGAVVSDSWSFYLRIPSGQNKPAGVYNDPSLAVSVREGSDAGAVLGSSTIFVRASIQHDCRFSTAPPPISANYTAFSGAAVPGSSSFALVCTQGTSYTMALDATRGVVPVVNLSYGITLSAAGGTGTAVAQPFTVNVSVDAGQAGTCAVASCVGTDTRTITVTY